MACKQEVLGQRFHWKRHEDVWAITASGCVHLEKWWMDLNRFFPATSSCIWSMPMTRFCGTPKHLQHVPKTRDLPWLLSVGAIQTRQDRPRIRNFWRPALPCCRFGCWSAWMLCPFSDISENLLSRPHPKLSSEQVLTRHKLHKYCLQSVCFCYIMLSFVYTSFLSLKLLEDTTTPLPSIINGRDARITSWIHVLHEAWELPKAENIQHGNIHIHPIIQSHPCIHKYMFPSKSN